MNKLYSDLKSKIERIQAKGSSSIKLNFYKAILGVLKYAIILTKEAGSSFPLLFQAREHQIIDQSYRDFKFYQIKVRVIFLIMLIILTVIVFKLY